MKKQAALIVVMFALLIGGGCATCPSCPSCPAEDVYFMIGTPYGQPVPVKMKKGFFDNPENFKTETEYQEFLKKKTELRVER